MQCLSFNKASDRALRWTTIIIHWVDSTHQTLLDEQLSRILEFSNRIIETLDESLHLRSTLGTTVRCPALLCSVNEFYRRFLSTSFLSTSSINKTYERVLSTNMNLWTSPIGKSNTRFEYFSPHKKTQNKHPLKLAGALEMHSESTFGHYQCRLSCFWPRLGSPGN